MTHSDSFHAFGSLGFRRASSPALSATHIYVGNEVPDCDAQPANVRIRRPLSITFDEDEDGSTERPDTD